MIKEVIVVEGKQDAAVVKRAVDAEVVITGGYGLHANTLAKIEHAYNKRGIIIFTDPDSAGERIRKYLSKRFPNAKHAFVPRERATQNNDIGVENASVTAVQEALAKVRPETWKSREIFTWQDIIENKLSGAKAASDRRAILGEKLGIGYSNAKQFLFRLNNYSVTREEFNEAVQELEDK